MKLLYFKGFNSLLHRSLFIKFSLLTTKQIISPATSTREKKLGRRGSRVGAVLVLNGQMSWHACYFDFYNYTDFKKGLSK